MKKSESFQTIHRWHEPSIKTEFGQRAMEDLGVIRGLEIDDTANYLLVPLKNDNEETKGWAIHRIKEECEVDVVSWKNLDEPLLVSKLSRKGDKK